VDRTEAQTAIFANQIGDKFVAVIPCNQYDWAVLAAASPMKNKQFKLSALGAMCSVTSLFAGFGTSFYRDSLGTLFSTLATIVGCITMLTCYLFFFLFAAFVSFIFIFAMNPLVLLMLIVYYLVRNTRAARRKA